MENELSLLVDVLPGLVWTADPDGRVDFLNRRWCEYTGRSVDDGYGRGWQTAIHPDDSAALLDSWRSILASGAPGETEARLRRFDGEYRRFVFRACPLGDTSGRIVKWCGIGTDIEDRRRAAEALHARWWLWSPGRERHFRSIADDIPALIALATPAGELEIVNRHVLEYLDAPLEGLRGRATADTLHPDDLPKVIAAQTRSIETGHPYEVEGRRRRADGVYRWFHMRGFPLRDTEGRVARWYIMETDIDDRKRAEALLVGEKRLLEMVALGHPLSAVLDELCRLVEDTATGCYCSVVLIDPSGTRLKHGAAPSLPATFHESIAGRPVNVDAGPCAMAAYLREQVITADIASETRWEASAWCPSALAHSLRACWATPILSRTQKVLGTFAIYHREPGTPTPFHQNLIERFTHIASLAIERTRSEEALKRSEAFLAEAQHLSSTGSFSWRVTTNEILCSKEAYRIFEIDPAVPVTLDLVATRVHPESLPSLREVIDRARREGGAFDYQTRLLMPDNSVKHLHVVAHGTRNEDGEWELIGTVHDVTKSRLSEEALDKARSELAHVARVTSLGTLTASIAHEVNQPLSGIVTNASTCLRMLAADPPNLDGARETARRTIRDGHRASDVITRLRALFGKHGITTESVDLNQATREVLTLSRSELQGSRVILRAELADDIPPVTGDRVQLQQVILNLLLNAAEAMSGVDDRPRQLVIRTERDDEASRVRLTVQDSGVGLDPHDVDRLFDAFYTTKSGGMGIGLSVSRSIIERHHGRLWAAPNDGPGATFSFSIPRASDGVTEPHSLEAPRTPAPTGAQHVRRTR